MDATSKPRRGRGSSARRQIAARALAGVPAIEPPSPSSPRATACGALTIDGAAVTRADDENSTLMPGAASLAASRLARLVVA